MKARRERKFVLLCLAALVALPLAQWWADLAAGQAPTGTVLLRRFPTVAHLRAAEADVAAAEVVPAAGVAAAAPPSRSFAALSLSSLSRFTRWR